jgi:Ras-related protein Rab-32
MYGQSTIGVDFHIKQNVNKKRMDENKDTIPMHFQLWDVAGQERFGTMTRAYFRHAAAAVIGKHFFHLLYASCKLFKCMI